MTSMKHVTGKYFKKGNDLFYRIDNVDAMAPFFTMLATDNDLWMYLSSTGGLSCGRRSPDYALFPYYTDDKITQNYTFTGPRTLIRVAQHNGDTASVVWEPFSVNNDALFAIERSLTKRVDGTAIRFEECNKTLGLCFAYTWESAKNYGWVRSSEITNVSGKNIDFEIIDGVQNVLPSGINRQTQNVYSTLVDAYKHTEQVPDTNLVLFRMEAIMVDKAEPSESLTCNTVYSIGTDGMSVLTSAMQLEAFRHGGDIVAEPESKGVQGAYLIYTAIDLADGETKHWRLVMDVEKDAAEVRQLIREIREAVLPNKINEAINASRLHLRHIVELNDGVIDTGDMAVDARHYADVLYNTMRGGYYPNGTTIVKKDFISHINRFNKALYTKYEAFLNALPETIAMADLEAKLPQDMQFRRLFLEFLPLTFSRRHGDPSRPWNSFDVQVEDKAGNPIIAYQGNWRDIFQNWEALNAAHPEFISHTVAKFLNATTADGYNPYRITSEGIDWEVINPDDPWSNIGYWGDHQIIYLCKLLEQLYQYDKPTFMKMLVEQIFSFANIPYRIKCYNEILANPKDTITFDEKLHNQILSLVPFLGADAKLLPTKDLQQASFSPVLATGMEKLLIPLLTKLSNFIPHAGVWMNTLRPEWNDANNALVGNGASMVTVYYMYRYITFLMKALSDSQSATFQLHMEVVEYLHDYSRCGEAYRARIYQHGFCGELVELSRDEIISFLDQQRELLAESIRANRREDGLYHAYNLVKPNRNGDKVDWEIEHLQPMLEGQVAVLSAHILTPSEAVELLEALRHSELYREDRESYMLYPNRRRASFLEMNILPAHIKQNSNYDNWIKQGILVEDCDGLVHFAARYRNANDLPEALKPVYEQVFHHHAFTGRSGTFYKYEGLGCIYWHMVSKLRLAVAEYLVESPLLKPYYHDITEGIGAHMTPEQYGAFPFDAYSHTPANAGAQQPGMTGQVKEDILCYYITKKL